MVITSYYILIGPWTYHADRASNTVGCSRIQRPSSTLPHQPRNPRWSFCIHPPASFLSSFRSIDPIPDPPSPRCLAPWRELASSLPEPPSPTIWIPMNQPLATASTPPPAPP